MMRHAVSTDNAPPAIGPYSQAVVANGFVFCSGTAGIDPAIGVAPDGIEEQTEWALRNLAGTLTAAGASMATVVKTTIFYTNVDDFATINAIYAPRARTGAGAVGAGQRQITAQPAHLHRRDRCPHRRLTAP